MKNARRRQLFILDSYRQFAQKYLCGKNRDWLATSRDVRKVWAPTNRDTVLKKTCNAREEQNTLNLRFQSDLPFENDVIFILCRTYENEIKICFPDEN